MRKKTAAWDTPREQRRQRGPSGLGIGGSTSINLAKQLIDHRASGKWKRCNFIPDCSDVSIGTVVRIASLPFCPASRKQRTSPADGASFIPFLECFAFPTPALLLRIFVSHTDHIYHTDIGACRLTQDQLKAWHSPQGRYSARELIVMSDQIHHILSCAFGSAADQLRENARRQAMAVRSPPMCSSGGGCAPATTFLKNRWNSGVASMERWHGVFRR